MRIDGPSIVNDVHSSLNPTRVSRILRPVDVEELRHAIEQAASSGQQIAICGKRHSMGGQQFARDACLIDMSEMCRALGHDSHRGLLEMQAGATWPAVINATHTIPHPDGRCWSIRQKQTGADDLSLGGAVASNVHGRGLLFAPIVNDIESLKVVTSDGSVVECSREQNRELFSLVVGGYGLFGVVASVVLRLTPRLKLRRMVDILEIDEAIPAVRRRIEQGCVYGDFQYAIDATDDSFLRRGVLACYAPVDPETPVSDSSADLRREDWLRLLRLAHDDKRRAFEVYSAHYLASHGRVYQSDTMQLSSYIPSYAEFLKGDGRQDADESLMIGEQFVPPERLLEFLRRARQILRACGVEDIYGTIRLIRRDDTTFLAWARQDYACVIFNLRTRHDASGVARTAKAFRELNDASIALGGSFYLTYHRFAGKRQIQACYPQFEQFLKLKLQYDPRELFVSDWYRHYRDATDFAVPPGRQSGTLWEAQTPGDGAYVQSQRRPIGTSPIRAGSCSIQQ